MNAAVKELTETFVSNLSNLIRDVAMQTVREALGTDSDAGDERPAKASRPKRLERASRGTPSVSRAKGAKRSPEDLEALTDKLFKYVGENPGERIEQIGAGLGVPTKDLTLPMKKLIAARSVRTTGQKRATTYSTRS